LFQSAFFRRLFVPYLVLLFIAILSLGVFAALRLHGTFMDSRELTLHEELHLVAQLIQPNLRPERIEDLRSQIKALGEQLQCRITVIRGDGVVLADNWANPETMENHGQRPEVLSAANQGEALSERHSVTIHSDMLYMATKQQSPDGLAFLRLAVRLSDLSRQLRLLYGGVAVVVLAALGGVGAISYYLARWHTAPIVELTDVAEAIARGDLNRRSGSDERGEIGTLARATNTMADSIQQLVMQAESGKAELLAILGSMSDGVIATDVQQRIRLANDAAGKMFGFQSEQAVGKPLWQVVRIDQMIKSADGVLRSGEAASIEGIGLAGRHLEVRMRRFPPQGEGRGLVVVIHDITESVRYQEMRKEFVANVSHELRTPLTVIRGYAETLADGAMHDPVKGPEYLATIQRHTAQLTNLVNDLLALSRLEGQPDLPRLTNVDMAAVARRMTELLLPAAQQKSQTLVVLPGGQQVGSSELVVGSKESADCQLPTANTQLPLMVVGNSDYLERAVANLIDNAIKYTPEGGTIGVVARFEAGEVIVEVTDNGIGIPAEDMPRIFERFYRVDRSRSREMGGTGLGLSIVKHVAHVHGGSVEVDSAPGKGSTFRLKLPGSGMQRDA
jgi:two-component system phosphate regulon sensor histidine kinase PhoR